MASNGRMGSSPIRSTKKNNNMYTVIYYNNDNEKVLSIHYSIEEVLHLAKTEKIFTILDEANNIVIGEIFRELNQTP